ncbi:DUF736 domain-containing protein [Bradyrhizobium sp. JR3.5]
MIIGNFANDAKADTYLAGILTLNFDIVRVPNEKNSDKEPDYRIMAPTENGNVELGAGWKRTSERNKDFISLSLDGSLLAAPFNAVMFMDEDQKASSVWTRSRPKAVEAANTSVKARAKKAAYANRADDRRVKFNRYELPRPG